MLVKCGSIVFLENKGYLCELTKEGIIFVDDEDTNTGIAIHIQTTT